METTRIATLHGGAIPLDGALDKLAETLSGHLIRPEDSGYDGARALWNGIFDRRPAVIARCAGTDDVREVVRFATSHELLVAVRGGGHNVAGTASVDGGLVIDLSAMNQVEVDPSLRRAYAGGGATWGDLDAATQIHGLAAPGGVVSVTGIGGLTLGGGIGWLRRKHGLACDNLLAAELVTADGEVLQVDEGSDPELLWGLRGGGGNLGVATRFEYQLHPVGPEVFVAFVLYRAERTVEILRAYRDYTAGLADEVSSFAICGTIPSDEDFPEEIWDEPYVLLMACAACDPEEGERLVRPLRDFGDPLVDLSGPIPYVELQQILDADYPDGMRYYWKSLHLPALTDDMIELVGDWAAHRPSPLSTLDIWQLGGAMGRVPADGTAFGDRSAPYLLGVESNWKDPSHDDANLAWTRECVDAFRHVSTGREYLNFPGFFEDAEATLQSAYGDANYRRLAALKRRLDPDNLFRLHHNVSPY